MKSLNELEVIRDRALKEIDVRKSAHSVRVVVGMATCGIAAGAKPVLDAFSDQVSKRGLKDVSVTKTGCIGVCRVEPIVEVYMPGEEKVTYVNVTPQMAGKIVAEHIVNGNPVTEYTIGYYENNN